MKYAKWVSIILFVMISTLHALEVSYGNLLKITGIERAGNKIVLPVEHGQYYNIRILGKDTYQFVADCPVPCRQLATDVKMVVTDVRSAKTDPNLWIVNVAFNQDWQATFLVFLRNNKYSVKSPAHLLFLQDLFKKRVEEEIILAVKGKNEV